MGQHVSAVWDSGRKTKSTNHSFSTIHEHLELNMTILRVGTNEKYADGWAKAFSKPKKKSTKKKAAKKKAAKKKAASKKPAAKKKTTSAKKTAKKAKAKK